MLRHIGLVILALSFAAVTGCHVGCCSKRASEKKCPTDVRKTHCWCFGEDALFRYPCGPNRVYYGHKATCWREWPSSGSEWRDAHCGPAMAPGQMPYDTMMAPPPESTAPAPGPMNGEMPNPFRSDADQTSPPREAEMPLPPQTQSPNFEPEAAPDQSVPRSPMSSNPFPPMASAVNGWQPEFQSWPASAEFDAISRQSHEAAVSDSAVPTVDVTSPPAVDVSSAPVAERAAPLSEGESQWRHVIHDQAEGAAAHNRDAALFRPPNLGGPQAPAATTWYPKDPKPSLEERTGAALRRFMSVDGAQRPRR